MRGPRWPPSAPIRWRNNLGFATVSGAAVRYRFYAAWGLTPLAIAKVVAFTSLTFGLGGFALGGLVLVVEPEVLPFFGEQRAALGDAGAGRRCCGASSAPISCWRASCRISACSGTRSTCPGFRMALMQTALATVDVAVTALIF